MGKRKASAGLSLLPYASAERGPLLNVFSCVNGRETGARPARAKMTEVERAVATKLPATLREQELLLYNDKVFAGAWLSSDSVALGTKCNKLFYVDFKHAPTLAAARVIDIELPAPVRCYESSRPTDWESPCGIHAMAVNPSGTLLATGSSSVNEVAIFSLPSMVPVAVIAAHDDWVFGLAWTADDGLVTCSRDRAVKFWEVRAESAGGAAPSGEGAAPSTRAAGAGRPSDASETPGWAAPALPLLPLPAAAPRVIDAPLGVATDHAERVRDARFEPSRRALATLSTDGSVKTWDPFRMAAVSTTWLVGRHELVALAVAPNLIAVGAVGCVTLLDPRKRRPALTLSSLDGNLGVRSLCFSHGGEMLSAGGGAGLVSFFDLRRQAYLPRDDSSPPSAAAASLRGATLRDPTYGTSATSLMLGTGGGTLTRNHSYHEHFRGFVPPNACYWHAWDSTSTRLFAAGGPLAFGLRGCYAGLWQS